MINIECYMSLNFKFACHYFTKICAARFRRAALYHFFPLPRGNPR